MTSDTKITASTNGRTGSVPPVAPQSRSSDRLAPADRETFAVELTACLALVAPVGMDEAARREWLGVAWETLKHLPSDILRSGCRKARESCDHPAKIVPAIVSATSEDMARRRRIDRAETPRIEHQPDYVTAEQAASILAEFGLRRA